MRLAIFYYCNVMQFLRIELGPLFQPDKLFANLNLFQLRYARKSREYLVSVQNLQASLTSQRHSAEMMELNYNIMKADYERLVSLEPHVSFLTSRVAQLEKELTEAKSGKDDAQGENVGLSSAFELELYNSLTSTFVQNMTLSSQLVSAPTFEEGSFIIPTHHVDFK